MENFSISCYDRSVNLTKQKHKNIIFTWYIKHIWHILLSMIYVKCYKSFFVGSFCCLVTEELEEMIKIGHRLVRDFLAFLYQEISFGDNNRYKSWVFCILLWNNTRSVSLTIFSIILKHFHFNEMVKIKPVVHLTFP